MDLSYFLKVLFRRKWYILGITFLAVVAALIFLMFKKNLYESVAQYSTGFTAEKVKLVDGSATIDVYSADIKFNNVIETFKSPKVIGMLSYHLLLHDLEKPENPYRKLTNEQKQSREYKIINTDTAKRILKDKLINVELLSSVDSTEKNLLEYLKIYRYDYYSIKKFLVISRVERTDYLNIVFRSENPELSAAVVNTLGEKFIRYYSNLTDQRTEESAENIKALMDRQQRKVDSISGLLVNEKIVQGTIDPVSRSTSAMETVKELETNLATEKGILYTHQQKLDGYKTRRDLLSKGSTANNNNDEILRLRNRRTDLMAENTRKGGNDPDLQRQIKDLTEEIATKSSNSTNGGRVQDDINDLDSKISEEEGAVRASDLTIKDYNSKISQYLKMTNVNPAGNVKMDVIQSTLTIENKALEDIKSKYNQAVGLIRDNPAVNIKQTLIGQPAVEPEPNKKMMTMGLSGISMFFLSSLLFLFLAIFDSSIKAPSQFNKLVGLKLLSTTNDVHLKNTSAGDIILENGVTKKKRDEKLFKQNLRKLRFELDTTGKKVFLFTSTKKGEGKSTLIEALACSMLLSKKKVLIIDTNFSNNYLTQRFNARPLLDDVQALNNNFSAESVRSIISKTDFENLDVIGCIGGSYTPSEIFPSDNLLAHLSELKEYDYIFLEGAAMNNYADTKELIQYTDGVISVFSAESSIKELDLESIEFLQQLNGKLQGAVLNKVQAENFDS
jgi:polysaccharide biosynthesis transport protein